MPRRILRHTFTALSLLLCVLTGAVWLRSLNTPDSLGYAWYAEPIDDWSVYISRSVLAHKGELIYVYSQMRRAPQFDDQFDVGLRHRTGRGVNLSYYTSVVPDRAVLGIGWGRVRDTTPPYTAYAAHGLAVPLWLLALPLTVLPAHWMLQYRRSVRNSRIGRCPACGYDLRASPERCPECGTPVAAK